MTAAIDGLSPARPRERWFDLCFRLIIVLLASLWLFMPPAGETARPPNAEVTSKLR